MSAIPMTIVSGFERDLPCFIIQNPMTPKTKPLMIDENEKSIAVLH